MTEAPHSPGSAAEQPGLSENETRLLDFERSWWSAGTGRDEAVREQLAMSAADYHRAVNDLIDKPEALAYDGVLVRRLRRQRDAGIDIDGHHTDSLSRGYVSRALSRSSRGSRRGGICGGTALRPSKRQCG